MKKILLLPLRALESLIDRTLVIIGTVTLVQFPQFYAQYLQRLGGHLDELRRIVSDYTKTADSFNLSLQEYIRAHLTSDNPVFQSTGAIIENTLTRLAELEGSFQALKTAAPYNRWWVFLKNIDPAIFKQTCSIYTPGLPITFESLAYALAGLLITWGFYQGIKSLIKKLFQLSHSDSIPDHPGYPAKDRGHSINL